MLEAVEESSRALPDVLNIHSFGVLKRAFHCTGVCGNKHPALLTDTNEEQCTKRAIYRFALSSNCTCWINPTTSKNYKYKLMTEVSVLTYPVHVYTL